MPIYGFYYGAGKKELVGSDSLFKCDGRFSKQSAIQEAKRQAKMALPKGKRQYVRFFKGSILKPYFTSGYIYVGDSR